MTSKTRRVFDPAYMPEWWYWLSSFLAGCAVASPLLLLT